MMLEWLRNVEVQIEKVVNGPIFQIVRIKEYGCFDAIWIEFGGWAIGFCDKRWEIVMHDQEEPM